MLIVSFVNQGNVSEEEMLKTFNCGIGAVLVVEGHSVSNVLQEVNGCGDAATVIGQVVQCSSGIFSKPIKISIFSLYN